MLLRSAPGLLALAFFAALATAVEAQGTVSSCFTLHSGTDRWGPLPDSVRILVHEGGIPLDLQRPPEMEADRGGWVLALGEFVSEQRLFVVLPRAQGWLHVIFEPQGEVMVGDAWQGEGGQPTREDGWRVEARPRPCPDRGR